MSSSRQIHDYVLCNDCEHRLNVGGEKYIGDISAEGRHFPLRDMLSSGTPSPLGPFLYYSGKQIGVDVRKVVYFAVSMAWRGAVHAWKTVDRQTSQLTVPSHLEDMRRFLMGEIELPIEIGVIMIVCLDFASQVHVIAPFLVGGEETNTLFEMQMCGVVLRVGINHPEKEFYDLACTHNPSAPIVVADWSKSTMSAVANFHLRARHAENVRIIEADLKVRQ
jgi:hypothetical protein